MNLIKRADPSTWCGQDSDQNAIQLVQVVQMKILSGLCRKMSVALRLCCPVCILRLAVRNLIFKIKIEYSKYLLTYLFNILSNLIVRKTIFINKGDRMRYIKIASIMPVA